MKRGIYTSEFWLTLGAQVIPVLVLLGFIAPEQVEGVSSAWTEAIKAVFALVASVAPVVVYIYGRAKIKSGG